MPLHPDYKELTRGKVADLVNVSEQRKASSAYAASFLEEFVDGKPWAHLDIAGTAWDQDNRDYVGKGASGWGVRLLVDLARTSLARQLRLAARASARTDPPPRGALPGERGCAAVSPASTSVEPRGGIASPSRTITFTSASRGSPSSRTRSPTIASASATGYSITSAPSRRIVPTSASGRGSAGSSRRQAERARERLERGALDQRRDDHDEEDDVEEQVAGWEPVDHREGREHDRDRAAQARPAEQQPLRAG